MNILSATKDELKTTLYNIEDRLLNLRQQAIQASLFLKYESNVFYKRQLQCELDSMSNMEASLRKQLDYVQSLIEE